LSLSGTTSHTLETSLRLWVFLYPLLLIGSLRLADAAASEVSPGKNV
jgi:hypothetical protein